MAEGLYIWQEICCRKIGDGCGGFMLFRLNMNLNKRVEVICPNCGHHHERIIRNGILVDDYNRDLRCDLTLEITKEQFSMEPFTEEMKRHCHTTNGNAFVINEPAVAANEPRGSGPLQDSWRDRFAGGLLRRRK